MTNFLLIGVALAAGYLLRKSGKVPPDAAKGASAWVLYVALPAAALKYLPQVDWSLASLVPIAMPVVIWLGAWGFVSLLAPRMAWSREDRIALVLTAGVANTSFVGFPLIQAFYGEAGMPNGILCDQTSFLFLSTVGIVFAQRSLGSSQGRQRWRPLLKSVAVFPPFVACVAALTIPRLVDLAPAQPLLTVLAATLAPLALFSVGLQLRLGDIRDTWRTLAVGLAYKAMLAPALVFALAWVTSVRGLEGQIAVFEAAMAPSVTAAVVAGQYQASPRLANAMVGVGIPLSVATAFLWWGLAGFLAA